jgi:adenosylhomocysteinase
MDMSFANQFLSHVALAQAHTKGEKLPNSVIEIPVEQDEFVAETKLATMDMAIDSLTEEQIRYIDDYNSGT